MNSVTEIIDLLGGMARLRRTAIRVEAAGFMPLCVEYVGVGPRGGTLVSVAHHYLQNGDLMADPEVVFEVTGGGDWLPVSYRQDGLGLYQEAVFTRDGESKVRPRLVRDLEDFARLWDGNLRDQGFVEAARGNASA